MVGPQAILRFGLEVAALAGWALASWDSVSNPAARWAAAVGVPVILATVWATFRVRGDAGASGGAPIEVPGPVRLTLELLLLLGGAAALIVAGRTAFGAVLGGLVLVHYATTPGRVRWLLGCQG